MRDIPLRMLVERLEDLITAQQKLASFMLLAEGVKLSVSTALDMLYAHMEMLDLTSDIINALQDISDDYTREYAITLTAEALSWTGFMLPYIESSSPIFIEHIKIESQPIISRIKAIVSLIERLGPDMDVFSSEEIIKTIDMISKAIRYQLFMVKRSYETMA